MGEISLINYLLLIFQKTRKKQDIINITQTGGNNVDNKILFVKLQNYLRISNGPFCLWIRRGLHMPLGKKICDLSKNVQQFPFDHFSIRVHNKLLTRVEDCKIPAVNCCSIVPQRQIGQCCTLLSVSRQTN